MQRDGARHRFRARVIKAGQKDLADKDLLALVDAEDDVHLVGVGRFSLLVDIDGHLLKPAAHILGQQRIPVPGQILGREQLARRGIQQRREHLRGDMLVALDPHRFHPLLLALVDPVGHDEGGCF